ncbi:uncharacterized protein LOC141852533 [Brevipalpus obovatus]|uniref:uncharacterized protein LOC141852533 n=1 Tax=Brevipalpus obovatus TaxID=246614 RepID=UPI003D9DE426
MLHAFFLIIHLVIGIAQSQQYDQSLYDGDIGGEIGGDIVGGFPSTDPSQSNLVGEFGNEVVPRIDPINGLSPNYGPLLGNDLNSLKSRLFGSSMDRRIFNPFNRILFSFLGPRLMRFQLDMMMQTLLSEVIRKMISPFITNAVGRLMNNDPSNNGGIKGGGLNLGVSTGLGSGGGQVSIGTGNGNGASMAPQISLMPSQMSNGQIQLIIKSGDSSNGGMTSVALGTPSNFANSASSLSGQNLPLQIPHISDNQLQQLMNAQLQQMLINKLPAQLVPQVQQQLQSQIQERIPLLQQQLRLQLQNQLGQQLANQIIPQSTMNGGILSTPNDGLNQAGQPVVSIPSIPTNPMNQPMLKLQVNPMNPTQTVHQPSPQTSFGNTASGYSIDSINRLPDNGPVLQMMLNSPQYAIPPSDSVGSQRGTNPNSNQEVNLKYSEQSAPSSSGHNLRINTSAHNQVRLEDSRNSPNSQVSFGYPGLTSKTNGEYTEEKVQISNVPSSNSNENDHRGSQSVSITPVFQKSEMNYDLSPPDSMDVSVDNDNSSHTSMANYEHIKETIQQLTGEAQPQVNNDQHSNDNSNGTSMEVAQSGEENSDANNYYHYAKNESYPESMASGNSSKESSDDNQDFRSENSNLHPILVYADFPHQQSSAIDQSMSFSQISNPKSQLIPSQMLSNSDNSNSFPPSPSSSSSSNTDGGDNHPLNSYHHDHNIRIPSPVSPTLSSPSDYSHNSQSDQEERENLRTQKITEDNAYSNSDPQSASDWADSRQHKTVDSHNSQFLQNFSDDNKEESVQPINYTPKLSPEQEKERKEQWQTMLKNLNRYYGY